jgi:hypothetical protein
MTTDQILDIANRLALEDQVRVWFTGGRQEEGSISLAGGMAVLTTAKDVFVLHPNAPEFVDVEAIEITKLAHVVLAEKEARKYGELAYQQPTSRDGYEKAIWELALILGRNGDTRAELNATNAYSDEWRAATRRGYQLDAQFTKLADEIELSKAKRNYIMYCIGRGVYTPSAQPMPRRSQFDPIGQLEQPDRSVPKPSDFDPDPKVRGKRSPRSPEDYHDLVDLQKSLVDAEDKSSARGASRDRRERFERIADSRRQQIAKGEYYEAKLKSVPADLAEAAVRNEIEAEVQSRRAAQRVVQAEEDAFLARPDVTELAHQLESSKAGIKLQARMDRFQGEDPHDDPALIEFITKLVNLAVAHGIDVPESVKQRYPFPGMSVAPQESGALAAPVEVVPQTPTLLPVSLLSAADQEVVDALDEYHECSDAMVALDRKGFGNFSETDSCDRRELISRCDAARDVLNRYHATHREKILSVANKRRAVMPHAGIEVVEYPDKRAASRYEIAIGDGGMSSHLLHSPHGCRFLAIEAACNDIRRSLLTGRWAPDTADGKPHPTVARCLAEVEGLAAKMGVRLADEDAKDTMETLMDEVEELIYQPGPAGSAILADVPVGDETPVQRIRFDLPDGDETLAPLAVGGVETPLVLDAHPVEPLPGVSIELAREESVVKESLITDSTEAAGPFLAPVPDHVVLSPEDRKVLSRMDGYTRKGTMPEVKVTRQQWIEDILDSGFVKAEMLKFGRAPERLRLTHLCRTNEAGRPLFYDCQHPVEIRYATMRLAALKPLLVVESDDADALPSEATAGKSLVR